MAKNRDAAAEAQRLWERARDQLIQMLQPGNPRSFASGIKRSSLHHRSPYAQVDQGLSFKDGRMPTPAEITAFAQQQPEYRRAVARLRKSGGSAGGKSSYGGGAASGAPGAPGAPLPPSAAMATYNDYLANQQAGFDEAKAENKARYKEGHGELTGVRDFRQEKYANFGVAAQQDIDERMQEALSNARANAAARGLSNTNVTDAYALRAARDTAREQQRVREMRDSRMADAYAQDTGNLVGFVERREDPYPDMNQAMQLGIQLAGSEADRQASADRLAAMEQAYRGAGGRGRSDYSLPTIPGPQGGGVPIWMNGTPLDMAQSMYANYGPRRGIASNRYPTKRTPAEYAAVQSQKPQYLASGGGITSNSHPVGLAANLAGMTPGLMQYLVSPSARDAVGRVIGNAAGGIASTASRMHKAGTMSAGGANKAYSLSDGLFGLHHKLWDKSDELYQRYWGGQ